jgi:protease-4
MEPPKRSSHGCLWAAGITLVLLVGLFVVGFAVARLAFRQSPLVGQTMGADEYPELEEVWSYGSGATKVVRIPLTGMILLGERDGFFSSTVGCADQALRSIQRATHDPDVKAIILEINSGGGEITSSDILYNALKDFKKGRPDRRVVAVMGDVAASGAYYVALAADHIVAHPTTITGSIGVLIQTVNIRELGQKIGIKDVTIKSGENKDILNPFGELTEEQRAMLQGLVDELHDRFVMLVGDSRHLIEDDVRRFADGRVFTATKAVDLGLVDQIGYWNEAMAKTAELVGVTEVKVYRYEERFSFSAFLKAFGKWNPVSELLAAGSRSRLMYMWQL